MKVVAVVPIKLNNERLHNKNILRFDNGYPLIYYILESLIKVNEIDEVYVYCSSDEITKYIPKTIRYIKRSKKLDSSSTKINEILYEFAQNINSDIYVLCHATSPFIKSESIQLGLKSVLSGKYDSAFAVSKIQDFMWKNKRPMNYSLENIPRTQDLEDIYIETSGFYIFDRNTILNKRRRIGENPNLVEVSKIEAIDIDEKEDFDIANAIYNFGIN